jgi:hypothetical protein
MRSALKSNSRVCNGRPGASAAERSSVRQRDADIFEETQKTALTISKKSTMDQNSATAHRQRIKSQSELTQTIRTAERKAVFYGVDKPQRRQDRESFANDQ